ncbi:response regulator [Tenuibacillus multivorans]|uniref:Two-component system, chemotaxis family, response regulator CheY n=1 Tax=Tenuibacillus multivorans TaxID=237069 RepID=A0A1G9ZNL9_9BACI|nr:response regulator [Tenuibacillus multivorans]GEL78831.1 chemotaxis protein CheY [Tenuibacillus multivorans]SDN22770.1 two-component system, chemotaxis family, response regulator CheY [Tenuibacillus multivorans]
MNNVLIADDSKFMRTWLKNKIEQHDFQVIAEANNGLEAILYYKQYQPNLVILDITMDKIDGITALTRIIKSDPNANIIMCSAIGSKDLILKAIDLGATDFIVKPYFHNLMKIINKSFENKKASNHVEGLVSYVPLD